MPKKKRGGSDGDPRWTSELRPAPGDLRIVQAFVNTAMLREGTDLAGPEELADLLALWELAPGGIVLDADGFERGREAREALRVLLGGNCGEEVSEEAVTVIDRAAAAIRVRIRGGGLARFEPADVGVLDSAQARVCEAVVAAQIDGTWQRLKLCADPTCRAACYDFSRNRSARWCSSRCGSRPGSLAYRRRNLKRVRAMDAAHAFFKRTRG